MTYQKHQNLRINNVSKNKPKKEIVAETNKLYLMPIVFLVAIYPLIMRYHEYTTTLSDFQWFSLNNTYIDFFLYYKQWYFIGISIIMVCLLIIRTSLNKERLPFIPIFIPLVAYSILTLISSIFSKYRSYSFSGVFEQFESIYVILGYSMIVYYIYLSVHTEKEIRFILNGLFISSLILGFIGLTQVLGHDIFQTNIGWKLITPSTYWNSKGSFNFIFGNKVAYLTLYNPNYVGVYSSIILPILFFQIISTKKILLKLLYLLAFSGIIICLVGSKSTSAIFSITLSVLMTLLLLRRYLIKYYFVTIPLAILIILSLYIFNYKYDNYLIHQIDKFTNIQKSIKSLNDIQTNDDNVLIKYNGNIIKTSFYTDDMNNCSFDFKDENNNIIPSSVDTINGSISIQDNRFPNFVFTPSITNDVLGFNVLIDGVEWFFSNQFKDGTYYYLNNYGRFDKIISAPSAAFTGYEEYASGRGYIWSRTLPLLKNYILFGSGADTFALVFPQQDYVNLYNYGYGDQFISKPHSLYLQIGVQSGVLSLIGLLVFYGLYFVSSMKLYFRGNFDNYYSKVGVTIFISTLSYMITGFTNDSSITIAPLFWVIIGLGIVANTTVLKSITQNHD